MLQKRIFRWFDPADQIFLTPPDASQWSVEEAKKGMICASKRSQPSQILLKKSAKTVKTKCKERRLGFNQAVHACQKKENIEQKGERWEWIST